MKRVGTFCLVVYLAHSLSTVLAQGTGSTTRTLSELVKSTSMSEWIRVTDASNSYSIVQLKYATSSEAQKVIAPLLGGSAHIISAPRINSLLVKASPAECQMIATFLAYYDAPVEANEGLWIISVQHVKPSQIRALMLDLLHDDDVKTRDAVSAEDRSNQVDRRLVRGNVHMAADDRLNLLFVIARRDDFGNWIERIVKTLDVEAPQTPKAGTPKDQR